MASFFKEQPLTAKQVRDRYRETRFNRAVDPLVKPTIVDAFPGDADGLMPVDKIGAPLQITLPKWSDFTEISGLPDILTLLFWKSGLTNPVEIGVPEEIPFDFAGFPLPKAIPLELFESIEGTFQFGYRVEGWNGQKREVLAPITIDRTGPIRPGTPQPIVVVEPLITDAVLTRDGGVVCVVPDFTEDKIEFVKVAVGWMATIPEDESDFPALMAFHDLLPSDKKITIPKKFITDLGSTTQYVVYFLFDKAGNRSEMSLPKSVQVALGELPSALKPCTVPRAEDDGLIDRADAAFPTTVDIEEYTGWDNNDGIVILWGTKTLARTSVGAHWPFPLAINIPWSHMRGEYDFTSGINTQPVDVDYTVFRGDYPTASPNKISVNTNFAIAGPENPDPEPINPKLELIRFLSSKGSDSELTPGDFGEDATGHIKLFDTPAPQTGDILTLWYNGKAVSSTPYTIEVGDTPGKEIPMVIPWDDIKRTLVMDDLPMYYTLTRPGVHNPQESRRTTINVVLETVDLPEPTFPAAVINCTHLREESGEWGIHVHIPTSPYLKEDVYITVTWQSYEADKVTLLPGTVHADRFQVSSAQEQNGIDWFIPYTKCLRPAYRPPVSSAGFGKAIYSIDVRGTSVSSDLVEVVIGVFEEYPAGSGNAHCQLTRPPRI